MTQAPKPILPSPKVLFMQDKEALAEEYRILEKRRKEEVKKSEHDAKVKRELEERKQCAAIALAEIQKQLAKGSHVEKENGIEVTIGCRDLYLSNMFKNFETFGCSALNEVLQNDKWVCTGVKRRYSRTEVVCQILRVLTLPTIIFPIMLTEILSMRIRYFCITLLPKA